jgi:hypothetical protein
VFFNWRAVAKAANWERMMGENTKPEPKAKSMKRSEPVYSIEPLPAYSNFTPLSSRSQNQSITSSSHLDRTVRTKLSSTPSVPLSEKKLSNYGTGLSSLEEFTRLNREKIASRSSSRKSSPKDTPKSSFVRPKEKHRELLLAIEQDKLRRVQLLRRKE